jgi:hypothetical protein
MSDFRAQISRYTPRRPGEWIGGDEDFEIVSDGPSTITRFAQLWRP